MNGLLHISDLHFGTERPEALTALRALAQRLAPEAIAVSGDITQRARAAQFAAARAFFESLPAAALLIVPGNHDIPLFNLLARALWPLAGYTRALGQWGPIERTWASPRWQVSTVNTTRRWRHQHGEVSPAQVARVATALREATPQQARVVMVHHPLAVPVASEQPNLLRGARALAQARWAEAGADLVLGGHIHLPAVLPLPGGMAVAQAGTAVSQRVRHEAGQSCFHHHHDGHTLTAERWDLGADGAFTCVQRTALALRR